MTFTKKDWNMLRKCVIFVFNRFVIRSVEFYIITFLWQIFKEWHLTSRDAVDGIHTDILKSKNKF